jgi:hypothetical protein
VQAVQAELSLVQEPENQADLAAAFQAEQGAYQEPSFQALVASQLGQEP